MRSLRLGDVIDDYCVKCRRVTNHAIVSLVDGEASKVRCRTCYHDHDYRHEQAPPSKKDLKKAELFNQVLAASGVPDAAAPAAVPVDGAVIEPAAAPADGTAVAPAAVPADGPAAAEPAAVPVDGPAVESDVAAGPVEVASKKRARKSSK